MRTVKITAAIATTVLLAGSVFANATYNSARAVEGFGTSAKNSKFLIVVIDGKQKSVYCMKSGTSRAYSSNFSLGSHTATYLQCADKFCKNVKLIGKDEFIVSKDEKGDLVSTPDYYQPKIDDGYGVNCDYKADVDLIDCLTYAHCTDVNTRTNNTDIGKWMKVIFGNNRSGVTCMSQAYGDMATSDEDIQSFHYKEGQKVVDTYFQCKNEQACRTGRTENEIKKLGEDVYTVERSASGVGYTSEPFIGKKIEMDPNFGENCDPINDQPDDNANLQDFTMSKATKKMYVLKNNKIQLVKDNKMHIVKNNKMQVIKGNKMEPVKN